MKNYILKYDKNLHQSYLLLTFKYGKTVSLVQI